MKENTRMMQCKIISVLQILLLLSILQRVCRGIDCYQCKSDEDKNCNYNGADRTYLRPCPPSYEYCRKSDSIYYFTDSRNYITIRECATLMSDGKECSRGRYSRDSYQHVCECKDSGCNRSMNLAGNILGILIVSQLLIYYYSVSLT